MDWLNAREAETSCCLTAPVSHIAHFSVKFRRFCDVHAAPAGWPVLDTRHSASAQRARGHRSATQAPGLEWPAVRVLRAPRVDF